MLEIPMIGSLVGEINGGKIIAQIRVTSRAQQSRQQGALVPIAAAALQQRQLRSFFTAEITLKANLVMDIIEDALGVVFEPTGEGLNFRCYCRCNVLGVTNRGK